MTGRIPFQNHAVNNYGGVIGGERPPLPDYVDHGIQEIVSRWWHSEPSTRPTFYEISKELESFIDQRREVSSSLPEDGRDADNMHWLQYSGIWLHNLRESDNEDDNVEVR